MIASARPGDGGVHHVGEVVVAYPAVTAIIAATADPEHLTAAPDRFAPARGNTDIKQERSRDMSTSSRAIGYAALALAAVGLFGSPARAQEPLQSPTLDPEWVSAFHWRSIGPAAAGGRILRIVVVESDPKVWYVSTASGGLWKTTNNGITFDPLFQH